jgi:hypothetical protein
VDKKAALTARRVIETEDVPLPTLGFSVTVRGLTRREALRVQGKEMATDEAERVLLALAMTDPAMTQDEVSLWQRNAPAGELQPVQAAIMRLSGMSATAVKDAMASFRS